MTGYYWSLKVRGRKYDAGQPRVPKGDPRGGQWTNGGTGGGQPKYTSLRQYANDLKDSPIDHYYDETTGSAYGQRNGTIYAYDKSSNPLGIVNYSVYEGTPQLEWIEVADSERGKGIGLKLAAKLQSKFRKTVEWTYLSPDGEKLKAAYDKLVSNVGGQA